MPIMDEDEQQDVDPNSDSLGTSAAATSLNMDPETVSAPSHSSINPAVQDYLEKLQAAQAQTKQNQMGTGLAAALTQLTHGLSRAPGSADLSGVQAMAKNDDAPITNLQAQQTGKAQSIKLQNEVESNDPTSDLANNTRSLYAPMYKRLGLDPSVLDKMSADQIKANASGPLEQENKQEVLQENVKSRIAGQQIQKDALANDAQTKQQGAVYDKTTAALQTARGDAETTAAMKRLASIKTAKELIDQYPNPDDMPPAQVHALVDEIGNIATQGSPAMGTLEGLAPNTVSMKLSSMKNSVMNGTSGANAGAFINEFGKYLQGQAGTQTGIINDRNERIIKGARLPQDKQDSLRGIYNRDNPYGNVGRASVGDPQSAPAQSYTPDVVAYASAHNISNDQAQAIKQQRGGQ